MDQLENHLKETCTESVWNQVQSTLTSHSLYKGQLVAFKNREQEQDDHIYRAFIQVLSREKDVYQVFIVDHGWKMVCKRQDLIPLGRESVAEFPLRMAMKIRLFDLAPKNPDLGIIHKPRVLK